MQTSRFDLLRNGFVPTGSSGFLFLKTLAVVLAVALSAGSTCHAAEPAKGGVFPWCG